MNLLLLCLHFLKIENIRDNLIVKLRQLSIYSHIYSIVQITVSSSSSPFSDCGTERTQKHTGKPNTDQNKLQSTIKLTLFSRAVTVLPQSETLQD